MNVGTALAKGFLIVGSMFLFSFVAKILAIGFTTTYCIAANRRRRRRDMLAQSGFEKIDLMTGREFEVYLQFLFQKLGYQVVLTKYVGDGGADHVITRNGIRTVVQAKRHRQLVGVKVIGEVMRAKRNYNCTEAMFNGRPWMAAGMPQMVSR